MMDPEDLTQHRNRLENLLKAKREQLHSNSSNALQLITQIEALESRICELDEQIGENDE